MTEIERYQHGAITPAHPIAGTAMVRHDPAANPLDGWIQVMADVAKLAEYIADTELVPDAVRRRPAAVAAIILTGREMGLPPMMALRHIHLVKGKPGMSAEIMRAQVLAAGHELDYVETSDTRCVVKGRRRGESEWLTVSFTVAQARTAKIDLGGYPEDKLVARATSRLCRRKFADCIAGIPTVDEIEDEGAWGPAPEVVISTAPAAIEAPAAPVQRTAQRRTRPKPPARPATAPADVPVTTGGPPLPGEDGYDDTPASDVSSEQEQSPPEEGGSAGATAKQRNLLFAIFRETDFDDRADRLRISSRVLGREIGSWLDLTQEDAAVLIDTFEALKRDGRLVAALTDLFNGPTDTEGDQP